MSLPLPADEIATTAATPARESLPPPASSSPVNAHSSLVIHTTGSAVPPPAETPRSIPVLAAFAGVPEVQPVTLPSTPGAPPSRRLLTSPHKADPQPAVKPNPYTLPNHVLPLALELQLANSINASGKGPLSAYGSHGFHLGASAAGVITTTLNNPPAPLPHQFTNNVPGALVNFGKRSAPWFDFNINYQYSRFTESYVSLQQVPLAYVPVTFQEISAEYIHTWSTDTLSSNRPRPFVGIGAGALLFTPANSQFSTQSRPSAVVDLGVDIPLHSERISFRAGAHMLVYKAPDFNSTALSSDRWVTTTEPAAGIYFHF